MNAGETGDEGIVAPSRHWTLWRNCCGRYADAYDPARPNDYQMVMVNVRVAAKCCSSLAGLFSPLARLPRALFDMFSDRHQKKGKRAGKARRSAPSPLASLHHAHPPPPPPPLSPFPPPPSLPSSPPPSLPSSPPHLLTSSPPPSVAPSATPRG